MIREKDDCYVWYCGHKLFLKNYCSDETLKKHISSLFAEQDPESPHCYVSDLFKVNSDDIVFYFGVAEGSFALSVINKTKKIFIFEPDKILFYHLEKTFLPFSHKVKLINKKVGNLSHNDMIQLDHIPELFNESIFIKIDVDSFERQVLSGMGKILQSNSNIKVSICTYHNQNDADEFQKYLSILGFKTEFSKGYMLFSL